MLDGINNKKKNDIKQYFKYEKGYWNGNIRFLSTSMIFSIYTVIFIQYRVLLT